MAFKFLSLLYFLLFIAWSGISLMVIITPAEGSVTFWKLTYILISLLGLTYVLLNWTRDAEKR